MRYSSLYIYGLEVLNPSLKSASYGPLDVGRIDYIPQCQHYCDRCKKGFKTQDEFAQHLWDIHPTKSPMLILGNRSLTSIRSSVRNRSSLRTLTVLNGESIKVNDKQVSLKQLNNLIGSAIDQFFQIDITNEGITKRFEIDVKLVSDEDIQSIDQLFFDCFGNGDLTNQGIDTFIRLTSQYSSAKDYVDGLVNYLVALQAKTGKANFTAYEQYPEKLGQSLATLIDFTHPLAIAICDLTLFMTNTLSDISLNGPVSQLNDATHFLLTGQHANQNKQKKQNDIKLPVDNATHNIIQLISQDFVEAKSVDELARKVDVYMKSFDYSPADKDKLNLVLFRKAIEEENSLMQNKYAKKLKHWDEIEKVIVGYE